MVELTIPSFYRNGFYALWRHYFFFVCEARYIDRYVPISPILLSSLIEYIAIPFMMGFLPFCVVLGLLNPFWIWYYVRSVILGFLQVHIYVRFFYLRATPIQLKTAHYSMLLLNFLRWTGIWTNEFPEMIE